jgi:hypothetical protein
MAILIRIIGWRKEKIYNRERNGWQTNKDVELVSGDGGQNPFLSKFELHRHARVRYIMFFR